MTFGFRGVHEPQSLSLENKIYWANVGDSRSILVRVPNLEEKFNELREKHLNQGEHANPSEETKDGKIRLLISLEPSSLTKLPEIVVIELSNDHKPDLEDELKRIEQNGGEVQPYKDDRGQSIGPPRVWVK